MTKTKTRTHHIPAEVWRAAEAILQTRLVVPLDEFEGVLLAELRKHYPDAELDAPHRGSRTVGLNLVDWVKAMLTREEKTEYVGIFIVWLGPDGDFQGKALVSYSRAVDVLRAFWDEVK